MREIKFRTWLRKDKIMCRVLELGSTGWIKISISDSGPFLKQHEEIELMQYTGLEDKNGTEIYEGDIDNNKRGVRFWQNMASFMVYNYETDTYDLLSDQAHRIEIIGNIYENPELLNMDGK